MRKLIAGFKCSIDGKVEGPEGYADWVADWSEEYQLSQRVDACIVGGGMYPGYEKYWTAIQNSGGQPLPMTGKSPTRNEIEWGRFAAQTPHYVLSRTQAQAQWKKTRFLRSAADVEALKSQSGKDIYLMGGAGVAAALIDAGLVDELRLILYPLIAGPGKSLFGSVVNRHQLELHECRQLTDGRLFVVYGAI